jgi:hypothetical protein
MAGLLSIAVIVAWFFAARWLARKLTSSLKDGLPRKAATWLTVLAMMLLPVADEIVGGFQFRALCSELPALKVSAEKIKGKTIRVLSDPSSRYLDGVAVEIKYSRFSYRDVASGEELAVYGMYRAYSGWLGRRTLNSARPMTFGPSVCRPQNFVDDLPAKFGFNITTSRN